MGYKHSRDDLLQAAIGLATTSGIGSLTFGAVGGRLGISDRTVVYYFPTKADMITSVIGALGAQLQEPYAALAPLLISGWVDWLEPRIAAPTGAERRSQALGSVALLDGLLLLRRMSGARAANTAARALGIG